MSTKMENNHICQIEKIQIQNDTNQNGPNSLTLKTLLQQVSKNENLHNCELILQSSSEKGDGYIGNINFCQIKGTTAEGKPVLLDLVVKTAPKNEKFRSNVPVRNAFVTENYHYGFVHPKFRQIQKEYKISDPFDSMARCFLTIDDEYHEALVLQNLKSAGYNLWDRQKPMNEEHVTFVMKQYGKLHAMSYALRHIDEEAFLNLTSELKYNVINGFLLNCVEPLNRLSEKVVKSFDEKEDALLIERYSMFKPNMIKFLLEETTKTDQYSIISHGDCWTNNMMFKYQDRSEPLTPSTMCFIDWQCSRLCPPAVEVSHFFLCNSPKSIIDNADKYLRIYYDSLSAHVRKFGGDPNALLPYGLFLEQWKHYCKFGFVLAHFVIKIQVGETEDIPDLGAAAAAGENALDHFDFDTSHDDVYFQRMKDIARYLVDNGCM